ncbi:FYVE, RhoGEF and PH domain-containing protein 4-like isoform X1 [Littorina saxatilis]
MRCGAPAVTRESFSEEDRTRFERDNDGFPIAADDEEIRNFDNEVFSGDARKAVSDAGVEVVKRRKSRSKSLSEVAALAKLWKLPHVPTPSKPKFLDRLITSAGLSRNGAKKRGRALLEHEESSVDRSDQSEDEDLVSQIRTENEGAAGYLHLRPDDGRDQHSLPSPQATSCWPVLSRDRCGGGAHADRSGECCVVDTDADQDASVSPPQSPVSPGLVKQRCETFKQLHQVGSDRAVKQFADRARSEDRGSSDSPRARRCFSPVSEKADRWVKSFYSLSRDKNFSKAVMAKGYVRALAEQINIGALPTHEDEEEGEVGEGGAVVSEHDSAANEDSADAVTPDSDSKDSFPVEVQAEVKCECPKTVSQSPRVQGENGMMGGKSPSPSKPQSPERKPGRSQSDTPATRQRKVRSPHGRRNSSETSGASTAHPQSPKTPKSLRVKPPVDYSGKPKLGSKETAKHPKINGESGPIVDSPHAGNGDQNIYDNVFFAENTTLTAEELFDQSWSDTDSDFTDSEAEEEQVTAQQVSTTQEAPPSTPRDKLHQVALELLTTERTYVQRLSLLHQVFYFRIDQENRTHGFLPGDTLTQMFSSIQSIHQFHNDFLLKDLEDRMKNWETERRIGDLMKKNAPFLKLYTAFIKNFDNAMNLINTWLEKSPKFASIIHNIQKQPECGSLSLQHHMLEPVQRVPRYEMLLKDYLKHLPEDSPDRKDAQDALDLVTKAAIHSNEAMKKIEKFHRLLDIYQRLRGVAVDFISPTRDFVREGPITKISARSGEKQSRYLFLFNDLLLICAEPLMGAYRARSQLDVDGMEVKHGDNLAIPHTFLVHSKQKAIELLDEQTSGSDIGWHDLLKKVIEDYRIRKGSLRHDPALSSPTEMECVPGKQAPRWIPDDAATMCMVCQLAFSAFRRRHHCRACGKLICKSCSKKAPLEYMNNKMERVCVACHDTIVFGAQKSPQTPEGNDTSPTKNKAKPRILQKKADDPGLLAGYLLISEDTGRTWNKRWFALHEDFVMYYFKARQDVSAYSSLPLPGYQVEIVSDSDKPNTFCVHHRSINKKGILFQSDNEKILKKWVNMLGKLVLAQLPDDSQRLSSQSNSSATSSGSDSTTNNNNNNTNTNNSDKLSQADSGCPAESVCGDSVTESSTLTADEITDSAVNERL